MVNVSEEGFVKPGQNLLLPVYPVQMNRVIFKT